MVLSWIFTVRPALTETAPAARADVLDSAAVIVPTAGSAPKAKFAPIQQFVCLRYAKNCA
jgi:hypothetical protein